jgi:hypothetical protein
VASSALVAASLRGGFDPRPARVGAWSPHGALTVLAARSGVVGPEAELGTFTWITSQVDGCSSKWRLSESLSFYPCLSVQLGALSARGDDGAISHPESATRFWASAGLLPVLSLHVHPVRFALGAGVRAVLTRYEFVFENPYQSVHKSSNIAGSLEFSVNLEP